MAKILIDKVTIPVYFDHIFLTSLLKYKNNTHSNSNNNNTNDNMLDMLFTYDKQIY